MSNALKWGLLAASILIIVTMIFALPLAQGLNLSELSADLGGILAICSDFFLSARNFINNLLTPTGRTILSGIIGYIFFKWIYQIGYKTVTTVYRWIFK